MVNRTCDITFERFVLRGYEKASQLVKRFVRKLHVVLKEHPLQLVRQARNIGDLNLPTELKFPIYRAVGLTTQSVGTSI